MNFKKIFLILLMICSIAIIRGENEKFQSIYDEENILFSLAGKDFSHKSKEEILNSLTVARVFEIGLNATNAMWVDATGTYQLYQRYAYETLRYIHHERPELIQKTLDYHISEKNNKINSSLIEVFINIGANLNMPIKSKEYTIKEKLEARFGSRKIDGIESHNCNGLLSKIFGRSEECKHIKKSLDLFEQEKAAAH